MLAGGLAALTLAGSGCAHGTAYTQKPDAPPTPYRIGRDDVVEISVYRDAELSRTVPVRPDGRISLPIAGEVDAAGLTPDELRTEIAERLKAYVHDPTIITLIVREVRSARFFVIGEVTRPGVYPLTGELTALQALALAGGLGEFSARDEVTVVRATGDTTETVPLEDLWAGRVRLGLRPGDTLVVP